MNQRLSSIRTQLARRLAILIGAGALFLAAAQPAGAADRIYWGNVFGNTISSANLDGSGAATNLSTSGTTAFPQPTGVAIDAAAGKIYWASQSDNKISFANLDGSGGGGNLNTTGTTVSTPRGLAIDPPAGKIYWANSGNDTISFANLDGTGGGGAEHHGRDHQRPRGRCDRPRGEQDLLGQRFPGAAGPRSGSRTSTTRAAATTSTRRARSPPSNPNGLAIDKAGGRIYWTNQVVQVISSAALAPGGDGDDLDVSPVVLTSAQGLAIDPGANKIYWPQFGDATLRFASLDDTGGGGALGTSPVTPFTPTFAAILKSPSGAGAPQVTIGAAASSGSSAGTVLHCSQATWAPDLLGSFLYRAPQSFAYQWSRNGTDISGATADSLTATEVGSYRCKVTATNHAGSTTQTSEPLQKFEIGKPKLSKKKGTAKLSVSVPDAGTVLLGGDKVKSASKQVLGAGDVGMIVKAKGKAKKKLRKKGKAKVDAEVSFDPTAGTSTDESKKVTLQKKR